MDLKNIDINDFNRLNTYFEPIIPYCKFPDEILTDFLVFLYTSPRNFYYNEKQVNLNRTVVLMTQFRIKFEKDDIILTDFITNLTCYFNNDRLYRTPKDYKINFTNVYKQNSTINDLNLYITLEKESINFEINETYTKSAIKIFEDPIYSTIAKRLQFNKSIE